MNKVDLKLVVIPDNHELHDIFNYDPSKYGSVFSTADEITVNKVGNEYSILYRDSVFKNLEIKSLMGNIGNLFQQNLSGFEIHLGIIYLYETNAEDPLESMDLEVANMMIQMDRFMYNNPDFSPGSQFNFVYDRHKLYVDMALELQNIKEEFYAGLEEKRIAAEKKKAEEVMINNIIDPRLNSREASTDKENVMSMYPFFDDDDDFPRKKKKKKHYDSSRVIKAAGNPKKTYKRHGVVVCSNKKAINRDEKTIKEFLKDFIPGDASWKKDLRKDLLKRWMRVYVVTKKNLKHLEKKHRQYYKKKDNRERNERILDFTQKVLTVPMNSWNDPTR